jgi:Bacterial regulatory proteins, luxR family/Methyltransferase domain
VLRLLAEGLTNRQIADRLVVSEHTVHRHVTNILRKLDLPSRTAAAAHAVQAGLLERPGGQSGLFPGRPKMAGPGEVEAGRHGYGRAMESATASRKVLAQAAALARIDEMGGAMATPVDQQHKADDRRMWALGDYHRFAAELVWELGPVLVAACGISAGQRVLDVGTGTGNVAIRAAEAGAEVVASDLTPQNFAAGRREARARGVELE